MDNLGGNSGLPFGHILPEELIPLEEIGEPEELSDGSSLYPIGKQDEPIEEIKGKGFYDNLALNMPRESLMSLSGKLLDNIKDDRESRSQWENTINIVMKQLGFSIEEFRQVPFVRACASYDSTLSSALIRLYATARSELFPAGGPCKSEILGKKTLESEDKADRIRDFLNTYLTVEDVSYYPDSERLVWIVIFFGCAFRKVYMDPISKRPVARLVPPYDLLVNNNTNSIMESDRLTEVTYLNKRDILLRQKSGDFIRFELPTSEEIEPENESKIRKDIKKSEGVDSGISENKSLFKFYEMQVSLSPSEVEARNSAEKDFSIPRPYLVTICSSKKEIVSIKRNWKEGDDKYKRAEMYVQYSFLPGFGIYSLGLAHTLGSNSITLTSILRQLIDAGTLKNFPGGLRIRGMRLENNDQAIGPSEFREVETHNMKLQDCIMLMPYGEPSTVLAELRKELKEECASISSAIDSQIPEVGTNAPAGTTLALLEVANKVQSVILRSLHVSLGRELQMLYKLFLEYFSDEPFQFSVPGKEITIQKSDFDENINVVPVSDPNILTSTYRLILNESMLKIAQSNPEIHDMREAYKRMYSAMKIEDIDALLPKKPEPQPLDPITDIANIMLGKPISVRDFQDNDSHIFIKQQYLQNQFIQANPALYANLLMNIQLHKCHKAYKDLFYQEESKKIEMELGPQFDMLVAQGIPIEEVQRNLQVEIQQRLSMMRPPELPEEYQESLSLMPNIQNLVAKKDYEEMINQIQQQQSAQESALDPDKVMMMDIEQRREAAQLKDESDKLKSETEAFKAQLKYESEMAKTDSQREIATDKNDTELMIASEKNKG